MKEKALYNTYSNGYKRSDSEFSLDVDSRSLVKVIDHTMDKIEIQNLNSKTLNYPRDCQIYDHCFSKLLTHISDRNLNP
jgi:hypothetical protein